MPAFPHSFAFDPAYGYTPDDVLTVPAPHAPADFDEFWQGRYAAARQVVTDPVVGPLEEERDGVRVHGVTYTSVGGARLGGWLALPTSTERHTLKAPGPADAPAPAPAETAETAETAEHGFVIAHGYGGRNAPGPDIPLPLPRSAAILPCVRGMGARSASPTIPPDADAHVLHGIASRDTYVIGDCAADLWCAASALLELVPELAAPQPRLGYLGESFGGGLGALALPWDDRFAAAQLTVPTFGNHPLRLTLPCAGSGESVRAHHRKNPEVTDVLRYFDAATAATRLRIPALVAPALFDPSVPPPGQFAVHNALPPTARELHVLQAGHFEYEDKAAELTRLTEARSRFFQAQLAPPA
ncbi:acetylxylan esterase [Streptomyces durmitorensis]|uniref:Acetylxylan esterase n=1 Tax=Streptomyces durmitorensis TaxID=319947 RepID=A0ABY4PSW7_9ACTN|nr:acetylxylan esterase [Streptomyces durmitorensis]UQT56510.1 acetylxylan esterase [Streptomyces durmitorensis]